MIHRTLQKRGQQLRNRLNTHLSDLSKRERVFFYAYFVSSSIGAVPVAIMLYSVWYDGIVPRYGGQIPFDLPRSEIAMFVIGVYVAWFLLLSHDARMRFQVVFLAICSLVVGGTITILGGLFSAITITPTTIMLWLAGFCLGILSEYFELPSDISHGELNFDISNWDLWTVRTPAEDPARFDMAKWGITAIVMSIVSVGVIAKLYFGGEFAALLAFLNVGFLVAFFLFMGIDREFDSSDSHSRFEAIAPGAYGKSLFITGLAVEAYQRAIDNDNFNLDRSGGMNNLIENVKKLDVTIQIVKKKVEAILLLNTIENTEITEVDISKADNETTIEILNELKETSGEGREISEEDIRTADIDASIENLANDPLWIWDETKRGEFIEIGFDVQFGKLHSTEATISTVDYSGQTLRNFVEKLESYSREANSSDASGSGDSNIAADGGPTTSANDIRPDGGTSNGDESSDGAAGDTTGNQENSEEEDNSTTSDLDDDLDRGNSTEPERESDTYEDDKRDELTERAWDDHPEKTLIDDSTADDGDETYSDSTPQSDTQGDSEGPLGADVPMGDPSDVPIQDQSETSKDESEGVDTEQLGDELPPQDEAEIDESTDSDDSLSSTQGSEGNSVDSGRRSGPKSDSSTNNQTRDEGPGSPDGTNLSSEEVDEPTDSTDSTQVDEPTDSTDSTQPDAEVEKKFPSDQFPVDELSNEEIILINKLTEADRVALLFDCNKLVSSISGDEFIPKYTYLIDYFDFNDVILVAAKADYLIDGWQNWDKYETGENDEGEIPKESNTVTWENFTTYVNEDVFSGMDIDDLTQEENVRGEIKPVFYETQEIAGTQVPVVDEADYPKIQGFDNMLNVISD